MVGQKKEINTLILNSPHPQNEGIHIDPIWSKTNTTGKGLSNFLDKSISSFFRKKQTHLAPQDFSHGFASMLGESATWIE